MSDRSQPQNLSEIGHLFLSSVRDAAGNGQPRPQRTPPGGRPAAMVEPTIKSFEPIAESDQIDLGNGGGRRVPTTVVLASHLGAAAAQRVTRYASQLCEDGQRVGLVTIDGSELAIAVFDSENSSEIHGNGSTQDASGNSRAVTQALDELAWDVDQWLIYTPATREPKAQQLLAEADGWALFSTCDHDGIVSSYRTLKGLAELNPPAMTLVCVDASDEVEAQSAYERIDGVCQQFLEWSLVGHASLNTATRYAGHPILRACWSAAFAPEFWSAVSDFFAPQIAKTKPRHADPLPVMRAILSPIEAAPVVPVVKAAAMPSEFPTVIDLPADHSNASAVVEAVIAAGTELLASPIRPPMCPEASVAIDADARLMLVAVAKQGLADLKLIGRAYQWLIENRGLVAMALPTVRIDALALPRLSLLVDQIDLSADLLQPLMMTGSVTVHAYRKLRWGDRVGMLLEAA